MTTPFPHIDHTTWKARLIKELKNHSWEDIQWQVDRSFSVEPLYEAEQTKDLGYLFDFHETWKSQRTQLKPAILASAVGVTDAETIQTAEGYGFTGWVNAHGTPFAGAGLPVETRGSEGDPFFEALRTGRYSDLEPKIAGPVCFHASDVHNAGGSAVQEIAAALLAAAWLQQKTGQNQWMPSATIEMAVGPQFWLEMCKFRAMRLLWMNFCHLHGLGRLKGNIRATTSTLYWSHTDSDINLLRHTIEAMAGILGGADSLVVQPHTLQVESQLDAVRLAVNISHLALEESHMGTYHDPAAGSYLADVLTDKLAKAAWQQFTTWHEAGAEKIVVEGALQGEIGKEADKCKADFADKKITMVGVNVFPSEFAKASPAFPIYTHTQNPDFQPLASIFLDV